MNGSSSVESISMFKVTSIEVTDSLVTFTTYSPLRSRSYNNQRNIHQGVAPVGLKNYSTITPGLKVPGGQKAQLQNPQNPTQVLKILPFYPLAQHTRYADYCSFIHVGYMKGLCERNGFQRRSHWHLIKHVNVEPINLPSIPPVLPTIGRPGINNQTPKLKLNIILIKI